ncbi:hypothetical protein [Pseudomonas sp. Irchel 3E20]|uniref:hypothetical protein n=1 Tax=Pseudomonas sp. Irchel 3E20 TaxID=2008983 RepID=UPI000BA46968|nr:hypothetical protein [Pseudomonas sp. Irchel 3E20]
MCGKSIKKIANVATLGLSGALLGNDSAVAPTAAAAVAAAPTTSSDSVQASVDAERKRRLAAAGQGGTILTGASGLLGGANTSQKTLLGV